MLFKMIGETRSRWLSFIKAAVFLFIFLFLVVEVVDLFDSQEKYSRNCLRGSPDVAKRIGVIKNIKLISRLYFNGFASGGDVRRRYLYVVSGTVGEAQFFVEVGEKGECKISM